MSWSGVVDRVYYEIALPCPGSIETAPMFTIQWSKGKRHRIEVKPKLSVNHGCHQLEGWAGI